MAKRRKRGDGGVSLRKDGRWEGRVVVGYDDKGLPVTKNVLAKTKSDCIAKLKALRDSIQAPAPEQPKPISGPTPKCPMSAASTSTSFRRWEIYR